MMEILLKKAGDSNFAEWMQKEGKTITLNESIHFKDMVELSTEYALQVGQGEAKDILEVFSEIYPKFKETIMTAALQLREEGRQEGMEARNLVIARNMLKDKEPIERITKWTGLSREELNTILTTKSE